MANEFSKEERVAFEDILEGFQDALVMAKNVAVYSTDQAAMERASDVIRRPQPYIAQSYNCLLYTSDAADDLLCVALGGRSIDKQQTRQ